MDHWHHCFQGGHHLYTKTLMNHKKSKACQANIMSAISSWQVKTSELLIADSATNIIIDHHNRHHDNNNNNHPDHNHDHHNNNNHPDHHINPNYPDHNNNHDHQHDKKPELVSALPLSPAHRSSCEARPVDGHTLA